MAETTASSGVQRPGAVIPLLTLTLASLALAVHQAPTVSGALSGWWTGHLSHWSWSHLGWDVGVFLVLGAVVEARHGRATLAAVVAVGVALGGAVGGLVHPALHAYRGLSAVDTALFAYLLASSPWLALLALKLAVEAWLGRALFAGELAPGVVVAVGAHLGGAVGGVLCAYGARAARS